MRTLEIEEQCEGKRRLKRRSASKNGLHPFLCLKNIAIIYSQSPSRPRREGKQTRNWEWERNGKIYWENGVKRIASAPIGA